MPRNRTKTARSLPLGYSEVVERHGNQYNITEEQRRMVIVMRANGLSADSIADVFGLSHPTVHKYFKDELKYGFELVRAKLSSVLVDQAMNGNMTALKFWLSNRCPEWRVAKEEGLPPERVDVTVHFYLPANGRDEPEQLPTIEGEAEAA